MAEVKGGLPVRRVIMLGAPGSGKGTQALHLAESLQVPAISTGAVSYTHLTPPPNYTVST